MLVPAYDHPTLWDGHASMITETVHQLPRGVKPDAVFCSVGGGGLSGGVMAGCKTVGWDDGQWFTELSGDPTANIELNMIRCIVPLITMETSGSNCFYQSLALNKGPFKGGPLSPPSNVEVVHDPLTGVIVARLLKISSLASSLGASIPSPAVVKMALERTGGVKSVHATDVMAMQSCLSFAGTWSYSSYLYGNR